MIGGAISPFCRALASGPIHWEDKSTREAAATLGIPAGTAKTRLRRARKLLELALDEGRLQRSA